MSQTASGNGQRPRVLYLVYWGAAEPLGQSLVLPAVGRLAGLGVELTLVTFEKPGDLHRPDEMARIHGLLADAGVRWLPLRYHKRPKWPATLWDLLSAARVALSLRRNGPIDVLHARTFVAGVMGLLISPLIGSRLVFHNEGFYPDEQVDGGFWKQGAWQHRLAKTLEGRLYDRSSGIIALSNRARAAIESRPGVRTRTAPVVVVRSCVDLERFSPSPLRTQAWQASDGVNLVYLGSTGGRYQFDQVGPFALAVRRLAGKVHVKVLTPTPPREIEDILAASGLVAEEYSIHHVPYVRVARELDDRHAGLFFLSRGLSEHACSPTKIGEYWAKGLPVVTTSNINDNDQIIGPQRVGVVMNGLTEAAHQEAALSLVTLLADNELPARCRRAAEAHYSLQSGCQAQYDLYVTVTQKTQGRRSR